MTYYQILMFTLFTNLCLVNQLPAQNSKNNVKAVKNIYDVIQNKNTSTFKTEMVPKMKWNDTNLENEAFDRYRITLPTILKNYWEQVTVINLQIEEVDTNVVIAIGELTGRQASDCVIVTTKFRHVWSLRNGNIEEFKEDQ